MCWFGATTSCVSCAQCCVQIVLNRTQINSNDNKTKYTHAQCALLIVPAFVFFLNHRAKSADVQWKYIRTDSYWKRFLLRGFSTAAKRKLVCAQIYYSQTHSISSMRNWSSVYKLRNVLFSFRFYFSNLNAQCASTFMTWMSRFYDRLKKRHQCQLLAELKAKRVLSQGPSTQKNLIFVLDS